MCWMAVLGNDVLNGEEGADTFIFGLDPVKML